MPVPTRNLPSKLAVDFSNVEEKRGSDYVPEGDYLARVVGCELRSKKDDPSRKYLNWTLQIQEPTSYKGKRVYFITSLVPESLWNLRSFLVDLLGEDKVPRKSVDIPLAKIVEAKPLIGISTADDEYPPGSGKMKTKVASSFSKADWAAMTGTPQAESSTEEVAESTEDEEMDEIDVDDL